MARVYRRLGDVADRLTTLGTPQKVIQKRPWTAQFTLCQGYLRIRCQMKNPTVAKVTSLLCFIFGVSCLFFLILCTPEHWYNQPSRCSTPQNIIRDMEEMLFVINHTLAATFQIPYFLCYGTLWGVIRTGAILPWDNNVNVCVLDEDISQVDEKFLVLTFSRVGIAMSYNSKDGVYYMRYKNANGQMSVFRRHFDEMKPAGWLSRMHEQIHLFDHPGFPERLVEMPLPLTDFLGANFPVPRENFEIMRYHYPDDWFTVGKPPGC